MCYGSLKHGELSEARCQPWPLNVLTSRNKTNCSVQFKRLHAAVSWKARFKASLWREEGGRREGGEGWKGWGLEGRVGGVVVDCFSFKSGIADTPPYQTTRHSGLTVSITEAWEGRRVRDPGSSYCHLHPRHTQTTSSSLGLVNFFHHLWDKLVEDCVQHYARHLLVWHRRASAKVGLNHPKGQPEELALLVLIKGECFILLFFIAFLVSRSRLAFGDYICPKKKKIVKILSF